MYNVHEFVCHKIILDNKVHSILTQRLPHATLWIEQSRQIVHRSAQHIIN